MWLLIMQLTYNTPNGVHVWYENVNNFQTEKACLSYASMEDKHLKRIKAQTNIKSFELNCYGR